MTQERCFIYGLVDPRTLLVHYVGLTSIGLKRPKAHRHTRKQEGALCKAWLLELHAEQLRPNIAILEVCEKPLLKKSECWWIAFGRAFGWPLTNLTSGGEGRLDLHPITRQRLRAAGLLRHNDPDVAAARLADERVDKEFDRARRRRNSRAVKARRSARRKALGVFGRRPGWQAIPEASRIAMAEKARIRQADPIVKAQIGARTRAALASPEARARLAERVRLAWTPERRAAMSAHARARQADPEVKKAISERVKAFRAQQRAAKAA